MSDEQIRRVYYPEIQQLMKEVTGATKVHPYSHFVRRDNRDTIKASVLSSTLPDDASVPNVTPARYIHIDESEDGAVTVLKDNLPSGTDFETLDKSRWSIINVWRAIKPISRDPLAVCDARTVPDDDLIPITMHLPAKGSMTYAEISKGESFEVYYARPNPSHRWYYVSGMKPEEVLLIKCFDSKRDGHLARRVPHSAFTDPETVNDSTRESLEVRCLVFYEDQPIE